jgi:hypothetical protein
LGGRPAREQQHDSEYGQPEQADDKISTPPCAVDAVHGYDLLDLRNC